MVRASINLQESTKQIQAKINKALKQDLDKALVRAAGRLIRPVRTLVKDAIMAQPEVASIISGQLRSEFGLPDGRNRIDSIVDIWTKSVTVRPKKTSIRGGQISAGLQLAMVDSSYKDVLVSQAANLITEKGQSLPWLEWLLRFGDKAIIRDYTIGVARNSARSRTGRAIMVKAASKRWKVPSQFAGTAQNNFVTRAIDSIEPSIIKLVETSLRGI